jgi:hypothetical protein
LPAATPQADSDIESRALQSLSECLRQVADARAPQGKVHDLHAVLCLVVIGLMSGQRGLSSIIALAAGHGARRRYNGANHRRRRRELLAAPEPEPWLRQIGLVWREEPTVPSLQTLIRLLGLVKGAELQEAMRQWVTGLLDALGVERWTGSVDGKAMSAAGRHVLSVFIHDLRLTALHEEVDQKRNELSTLRGRVEWLLDRYPGLWLLCGDAMFSDAKLCDLLKNRGRHWMFQVKANQPHLMEKMEIVFSPIVRRAPHASDEPEKKRGVR